MKKWRPPATPRALPRKFAVMPRFPITDFPSAAGGPILDVRAPAEYVQGHVPGARSLPLFTDDERARIGTTYKQVNPEKAVLLGLDFFGPKMRALVEASPAAWPPARKCVCTAGAAACAAGPCSGCWNWPASE
ncbi:MAG: rhodanese-like domain-containing protein [Hymenobacter sp.]